MLSPEELLAPLEQARPCGPPLADHPAYEEFRTLSRSSQRPDWARLRSQAVTLVQASRDLRAWIWFTRASLCSEGVPGLASGLELIADGLLRYWDVLPPLDLEEARPRERFFKRLTALAELGVTNDTCSVADLNRNGRTIVDLRADLDAAVAKAAADPGAAEAVGRARAAAFAITQLFAERFGKENDPHLGFEEILQKLGTIRPAPRAESHANGEAVQNQGADDGRLAPDNLNSRKDVIRMLDVILGYYTRNEPSSPVPMVLERAKRLVPLTFAEALKELAPSGLKELQAATGTIDEKK